jgi:hypothetical protein
MRTPFISLHILGIFEEPQIPAINSSRLIFDRWSQFCNLLNVLVPHFFRHEHYIRRNLHATIQGPSSVHYCCVSSFKGQIGLSKIQCYPQDQRPQQLSSPFFWFNCKQSFHRWLRILPSIGLTLCPKSICQPRNCWLYDNMN